ncbi:MAG: diguanylate cyclase [Acidimicrobiales bacterium]
MRTSTLVAEVGELWAVHEGLMQLALTDPADPPAQLARHGGAAAAGDRRPRPPPRPRSLLLFCDLDGLKEINDTAGHAAGDQALVEFAHCLAGALRAGDGAARLGGDEFVALVPHLERRTPRRSWPAWPKPPPSRCGSSATSCRSRPRRGGSSSTTGAARLAPPQGGRRLDVRRQGPPAPRHAEGPQAGRMAARTASSTSGLMSTMPWSASAWLRCGEHLPRRRPRPPPRSRR